jgi:hypothetical protein
MESGLARLCEDWQLCLNNAIEDGKSRGLESSAIVDAMLLVAFSNKAHLHGGQAATDFYGQASEMFIKIKENLAKTAH